MAQLAETLRDLDVPVSVIADIDLLKEENAFRNFFQKLGGDWSEVVGHFQAIKSSVEQRRPPMNADKVASIIRDSLDGVGGTGDFPRSTESEIKRVFNVALSLGRGEIERSSRSLRWTGGQAFR